MRDHNVERANSILEHLELDFAADFAQAVEKRLRRLTDQDINTLYLLTHTDANLGEEPHRWIAVLMPLIEWEWEIRRDIARLPHLGPVLAPELYQKGGARDLPF